MNINEINRQHVGTRFIASTSAHTGLGRGRDKSRPYIIRLATPHLIF